MPGHSKQSSSSSEHSASSESSKDDWTGNEGESTDCDVECPADAKLRGRVALVSAKCPRQYLRAAEKRKAKGTQIPSDMEKGEFLLAFRRLLASQCTAKLEAATCHVEPHLRKRISTQKREPHYHLAVRMSDNFPHKRIADAFYKKHGIQITFSFKLKKVGRVFAPLDETMRQAR